ncbi:MAG: hypothetical protein ACFHX7_08660 [Pseudomonadota bacterium]
MIRAVFPFLVACCLLAPFAAEAGVVTPYLSDKVLNAQDDGVPPDATTTSAAITFGSESLLAVENATFARLESNWADTGAGALFDFDVAMQRSGLANAYSEVREDGLRFTVSQDTSYSISGALQVDDVGSVAGRVYAYVTLRDLTANQWLFIDRSESIVTTDELFVVGALNDGDYFNNTYGNLSGLLLSGHAYQFGFHYWLQSDQGANSGASATGCVTLALGGATGAGSCGPAIAVPAPGALALFGLGLVLLAWRRLSIPGRRTTALAGL